MEQQLIFDDEQIQQEVKNLEEEKIMLENKRKDDYINSIVDRVHDEYPISTREITVSFDYNDELNDEQIKTIFNSPTIDEAITDIEFELHDHNLEYIDQQRDEYLDDILYCLELEEDEEYLEFEQEIKDKIRDVIRDEIPVNIEIDDLMERTKTNVYLRLLSNYDYCGHYISYESSYFKTLFDMLNINPYEFKKLADEKELETEGEFPNIIDRNGKEAITLSSLITECQNMMTGTNLFTVGLKLDCLDAVQFFKDFRKAEYLTIEKNTICGLFDDWQGSGSMMECEATGNSRLKIKGDTKYDRFELYVEQEMSYTAHDVFGTVSSWFDCGNIQFHETEID